MAGSARTIESSVAYSRTEEHPLQSGSRSVYGSLAPARPRPGKSLLGGAAESDAVKRR
jgi:hypothetical protein